MNAEEFGPVVQFLYSIAGFAGFALSAYVFADIGYSITKNSVYLSIQYEMRGVVLVVIPFRYLFFFPFAELGGFFTGLFMLVEAYWWWRAYKTKDDRWKKRRKKALAKVKEVAGKLVVVPEPAPIARSSS